MMPYNAPILTIPSFRYDGTNNLSTVEMYKEESDSWSFAPSLSDHEGGIAVAVLPIPPQLLSSTEYSNLGYCKK